MRPEGSFGRVGEEVVEMAEEKKRQKVQSIEQYHARLVKGEETDYSCFVYRLNGKAF